MGVAEKVLGDEVLEERSSGDLGLETLDVLQYMINTRCELGTLPDFVRTNFHGCTGIITYLIELQEINGVAAIEPARGQPLHQTHAKEGSFLFRVKTSQRKLWVQSRYDKP